MRIITLPAYKGDAILVELDNDLKTKILIDTGTKRTYVDGTIKKILNTDGQIDLLILTHIDEDHIGGMIKYFADAKRKENTFKEIWFNSGKLVDEYFNLNRTEIPEIPILESKSKEMSVKQGISLEKELEKTKTWFQKLILTGDTFNLEGAEIQILSPQIDTLKELLEVWEIEKSSQKKMSYKTDYHKTIKEFQKTIEEELEEKGSLANESSIAFLLNYLGKKILFGGDAFPSVICNSLKKLGFSPTNKIKLDLFKVSHHASKFAVSNELLEMIECKEFIISTNGHGGLPSKECLSRIISYQDKPKLHFNYSNSTIKNIFFENELQSANFVVNYLDKQNYTIEI